MADAGTLTVTLSRRIAAAEAQANAAMMQHAFHERAARDSLEKANAESGAAQAFKVALQDLQQQEAADEQAAKDSEPKGPELVK